MAYYEDIVEITGKAKCVLCDENLPDDNNLIDAHINGDQHVVSYIKRVMFCNNISFQHGKPYCHLCGTNISSLINHVQSTQHKHNVDQIKNMVEKDGAFLELPTKVSLKDPVNCTICDCQVEFSEHEIKTHIQSQKHRRARSMAVQPYNGIFSVEGTDDDLWCKICQSYFENYIEIIFQHVDEDERHVSTINKILRIIEGQEIMIDKYLTNAVEDKATCNKCGIEVPCNIDNLSSHVKGKRHKNT